MKYRIFNHSQQLCSVLLFSILAFMSSHILASYTHLPNSQDSVLRVNPTIKLHNISNHESISNQESISNHESISNLIRTISFTTLSPANGNNLLNYPVEGSCESVGDLISLLITDKNSETLSQAGIICQADGNTGQFTTNVNISSLADGQITIVATITNSQGGTESDTNSLTKSACTPNNSSPFCDNDEDGIPDLNELALDMNPLSNDSDQDGITDTIEVGSDIFTPTDTDGDGTIDALDSDSDNDGFSDTIEGGGNPSSPLDSDNDGRPDFQDRDSDNDRIPDIVEANISSSDVDSDGIPNYLDKDSDGDGIPDAIENGLELHRDSDNDGIDNEFDVSNTGGQDNNNDGIDDDVLPVDTDSDGQPDAYDRDSDRDGIADQIEANFLTINDADADGIPDSFDVDNTSGTDTDLDGIDDSASVLDTDNDSIPNYLDLDSDNDGQSDVSESGGTDSSPEDSLADNNEITSEPTDTDSDSIPDFLDLESNDDTNDNIAPFDIDSLEDSSLDRNNNGVLDDTLDTDGDGIMNSVDYNRYNFGSLNDLDQDGVVNAEDLDNDNDGIPDIIEGSGSIDTDADGQPDHIDLDSDNDGISDLKEAPSLLTDADNDGRVDELLDTDGNGLDDSISSGFSPIDTDDDNVPNYRDLDSDGDSIFDLNEANDTDIAHITLDADENGMIDQLGSSGLTQTRFINSIDTDSDTEENYLDLDSDNDGFTDNQENGDFNGNGVHDAIESHASKLDTAIQGGGGSVGYFGILLTAILTCFRLTKLNASAVTLVFLSLISGKVLSHDAISKDKDCTQWLSPQSPHKMLEIISDNLVFQPCWYVATGIGTTYLSPEGESNGWSINDKYSYGISILAGRNFTDNWALELSYNYLGEAELKNSNPSINSTVDAAIRYQGASIMLLHRWLNENRGVNFYTKFGSSFLNTQQTHSSVGYEKKSEIQFSFGAGLHLRLQNSPWFINVDYQSMSKDASLTSLQVGRYFGFSPTLSSDVRLRMKQYENKALLEDDDNDKVLNDHDLCPNTPPNTRVNAVGCCMKSDGCLRIY